MRVWEASFGGGEIRNQHIGANMWKDLESGELDLFPGIQQALNKCLLNGCMSDSFSEVVFKSLVVALRELTALQGSPEG